MKILQMALTMQSCRFIYPGTGNDSVQRQLWRGLLQLNCLLTPMLSIKNQHPGTAPRREEHNQSSGGKVQDYSASCGLLTACIRSVMIENRATVRGVVSETEVHHRLIALPAQYRGVKLRVSPTFHFPEHKGTQG